MATKKTTETKSSVQDFLKKISDKKKKADAESLLSFFQKVTKHEPKMWGPSIIGFGTYHYKYDSGHEGDAPLVGFSPRASAFSIYFCETFDEREELLAQLGKHKSGKGCVYVQKLEDIKLDVLKKMTENNIKELKRLYSKK